MFLRDDWYNTYWKWLQYIHDCTTKNCISPALIFAAGNGQSMVILNTADYEEKALTLLQGVVDPGGLTVD
jgi:hypothetical protein